MDTSTDSLVHFQFNFGLAAAAADDDDDDDDGEEDKETPAKEMKAEESAVSRENVSTQAIETPGGEVVVLPTQLLDANELLQSAQDQLDTLVQKSAKLQSHDFQQDDDDCQQPWVQDVELTVTPRESAKSRLQRISGVDWADFGNSDLVPGKYGGGLRLWECAVDLCKFLNSCLLSHQETQPSSSSDAGMFWYQLRSKIVQRAPTDSQPPTIPPPPSSSSSSSQQEEPFSILELGCGHALPAIVIWKESPKDTRLVLADYNDFVLKQVTAINVILNGQTLDWKQYAPNVQFVAGDWIALDKVLSSPARFHVLVAAETTFSRIASMQTAQLMARHLLPHGVGIGLVATKRYYFGVGGGSVPFVEAVQKLAPLKTCLVQVHDDGRGNIRELWMVWSA